MPIHPDPLSEHHEKNKDMQEVVSKKGEGKPNQKRRRGKQQKKKKKETMPDAIPVPWKLFCIVIKICREISVVFRSRRV
jgi:hypothetical protein